MAPTKKTVLPKDCECVKEIKDIYKLIDTLKSQITDLKQIIESKQVEKIKSTSIHKVEDWYDKVPEQEESKFKMNHQDKIQSATNAIKILPPNLIVNGRHDPVNIGAICGFVVTDEMLEEIYSQFSHEG